MLTALLLIAVAHADPSYPPVAGLDFSVRTPYQFVLLSDGESLTYNVYQPEGAAYAIGMIEAAVAISSGASIRQIQAIAPNARPCSHPSLDIYEISEVSLNDPARFPERFIGNPLLGRGPLWGYFDPSAGGSPGDVIVVSDHGPFENRRILEHEVAHRWYAAYCLDRYTSMSSEAFALRVAEG